MSVTLNIEGTRTQISEETAKRSTWISNLAFGQWADSKKEEIFIDEDFDLFMEVINWMRNPSFEKLGEGWLMDKYGVVHEAPEEAPEERIKIRETVPIIGSDGGSLIQMYAHGFQNESDEKQVINTAGDIDAKIRLMHLDIYRTQSLKFSATKEKDIFLVEFARCAETITDITLLFNYEDDSPSLEDIINEVEFGTGHGLVFTRLKIEELIALDKLKRENSAIDEYATEEKIIFINLMPLVHSAGIIPIISAPFTLITLKFKLKLPELVDKFKFLQGGYQYKDYVRFNMVSDPQKTYTKFKFHYKRCEVTDKLAEFINFDCPISRIWFFCRYVDDKKGSSFNILSIKIMNIPYRLYSPFTLNLKMLREDKVIPEKGLFWFDFTSSLNFSRMETDNVLVEITFPDDDPKEVFIFLDYISIMLFANGVLAPNFLGPV